MIAWGLGLLVMLMLAPSIEKRWGWPAWLARVAALIVGVFSGYLLIALVTMAGLLGPAL